MDEPRRGDRIRHQDIEGVVTYVQPRQVRNGRALVPVAKRYIVITPDTEASPITIWEDEWPEIEILEPAD